MDYTSAVEFLRDLKNNTYHFNIRQRMKMLLVVIGELSLKAFGYIKPITPAELDNYIDEVIERLENQKQYLKNETEVERINQEIALDELEQFL